MSSPSPAPTRSYDHHAYENNNFGLYLAIIIGTSLAVGFVALICFGLIVYWKKRMKGYEHTHVDGNQEDEENRTMPSPIGTVGKYITFKSPLKAGDSMSVDTTSQLTSRFSEDTHALRKLGSEMTPRQQGGNVKIVNKAFLYLKPHANNISTQSFLRDWLYSKGLLLVEEKIISGSRVLQCFDKQYSSIGRRAVLLKPHELDVSPVCQQNFYERFGLTWHTALEQGLVKNATGTCSMLEIDHLQLMEAWMRSWRGGLVIRFGRGFYCGRIDDIPDKTAIFCVNGFYPAMRAEYAATLASVYSCSVVWEDRNMSWAVFRDDVIGCTDPEAAHPESLRGIIHREWRELGLHGPLNIKENALHASASAFEAFAERCNWLGSPWMSDPLGCRLFSAGMTPQVVEDWINNTGVKGQCVFDRLENLGCHACLDIIKEIFTATDVMYPLSSRDYMSRIEISNSAVKSPGRGTQIRRNSAFLFFKPGASTSTVVGFTRDWLVKNGFFVVEEGGVAASVIEKNTVIDKQYADIARRAYLQKPTELVLPATAFIRFQKKFGISWSDALHTGAVLNAVDTAAALGMSHEELNSAWMVSVEKGNIIRFDRGFYCGLIEKESSMRGIYCINGFYMAMRAKYTFPGQTTHYMQVEWEDQLMNWETFRRKVIGSTNPSLSHPKSLRYLMFVDWKSLELPSQPNIVDNCVHASSSALEALYERCIWLGTSVESGSLSNQLQSAGISVECLKEWSMNPHIAGKRVFDHMVNKGAEECIETALNILSAHNGSSTTPLLSSIRADSVASTNRIVTPLNLSNLRLSYSKGTSSSRKTLDTPVLRSAAATSREVSQRDYESYAARSIKQHHYEIGSSRRSSRQYSHKDKTEEEYYDFPLPDRMNDVDKYAPSSRVVYYDPSYDGHRHHESRRRKYERHRVDSRDNLRFDGADDGECEYDSMGYEKPTWHGSQSPDRKHSRAKYRSPSKRKKYHDKELNLVPASDIRPRSTGRNTRERTEYNTYSRDNSPEDGARKLKRDKHSALSSGNRHRKSARDSRLSPVNRKTRKCRATDERLYSSDEEAAIAVRVDDTVEGSDKNRDTSYKGHSRRKKLQHDRETSPMAEYKMHRQTHDNGRCSDDDKASEIQDYKSTLIGGSNQTGGTDTPVIVDQYTKDFNMGNLPVSSSDVKKGELEERRYSLDGQVDSLDNSQRGDIVCAGCEPMINGKKASSADKITQPGSPPATMVEKSPKIRNSLDNPYEGGNLEAQRDHTTQNEIYVL